MKDFKEGCVYISPFERKAQLKSELKNILLENENFFLCQGPEQKTYWAQNVWRHVKLVPVESIGKATKVLKEHKLKWTHYSMSSHRRGELILEQLNSVKAKKIKFGELLPTQKIGAFSLLSEKEMLFSVNTREPVKNGEYVFEEPDLETPSEAYLKLWEALTRMGKFPKSDDYVVDLGSSPGSWTQSLLAMGAQVLSVDRAPLEIDPRPSLDFQKRDAFKLEPNEVEKPDWIFSDIICFPDKLLELALKWKKTHPKARFVFSIKFQGEWSKEIVEKLEAIPGSRILRLFNNKHELCWVSGQFTSQPNL
jgi:23S rRNA (cytidine2498-2'-O)-methyltransferase